MNIRKWYNKLPVDKKTKKEYNNKCKTVGIKC